MSKTISGDKFERDRSDYDYQLYVLQKENLELTIKHQKQFWRNTIISVVIGMMATISIQFLSDRITTASKKKESLLLELCIESNRKIDSMSRLNISHTHPIDSLKKK